MTPIPSVLPGMFFPRHLNSTATAFQWLWSRLSIFMPQVAKSTTVSETRICLQIQADLPWSLLWRGHLETFSRLEPPKNSGISSRAFSSIGFSSLKVSILNCKPHDALTRRDKFNFLSRSHYMDTSINCLIKILVLRIMFYHSLYFFQLFVVETVEKHSIILFLHFSTIFSFSVFLFVYLLLSYLYSYIRYYFLLIIAEKQNTSGSSPLSNKILTYYSKLFLCHQCLLTFF